MSDILGYIGTLSAVDLVLVCLLTIPRHASPVFAKCGLKSAMSEKRDLQLKRCVHKLSKSLKVDLRKSPLKLWTCKRLKFN